MKKLFIWFLVVVFAVSVAFMGIGCKKAEEAVAPVEEVVEEAVPAEEEVGEAKKIVYWSMWNDPEPQAEVIKGWIEDYKEIHPEITIEVTFVGRDLLTKLMAARSGGEVIDLIDKDGGVTTIELADKLGVSLSTIRRDLNNLEKNGLILKTHGGAVPRSFSTSYEPPYHLKSHLQKREKELIGKLASSFIKEGDTVIFDSGTTVFQMAHYSREKQFSAIALDLA